MELTPEMENEIAKRKAKELKEKYPYLSERDIARIVWGEIERMKRDAYLQKRLIEEYERKMKIKHRIATLYHSRKVVKEALMEMDREKVKKVLDLFR